MMPCANTCADPEAGTIDLEPYMDQALEEVVEVISLFAQYPQPRTPTGRIPTPPQPRKLFDLYDFVDAKYDRAELVEMAVEFLTSWGSSHDDIHSREVKKMEKMLDQELAGSEIVRNRALELAEEE